MFHNYLSNIMSNCTLFIVSLSFIHFQTLIGKQQSGEESDEEEETEDNVFEVEEEEKENLGVSVISDQHDRQEDRRIKVESTSEVEDKEEEGGTENCHRIQMQQWKSIAKKCGTKMDL